MDSDINRRPLLEDSDSDINEDINKENEIGVDHIVSQPQNNAKIFLKTILPPDKYNLSYFIFYLLGMTTLLPWCFYVTANEASINFFLNNYIYSNKLIILLVLDV